MKNMVFWKPVRSLGWAYVGGAIAKLLRGEWSGALSLALAAGAMWLVATLAAEQDEMIYLTSQLREPATESGSGYQAERPMSLGWKIACVVVGIVACWYVMDSGHGDWSTLLAPTVSFAAIVLLRMQERGSAAVSIWRSRVRELRAEARAGPAEVAFLKKYAQELVDLGKQQILASTSWGARAARETYLDRVNELRNLEGLPPLRSEDVRLY
jgi:hypothetical protein